MENMNFLKNLPQDEQQQMQKLLRDLIVMCIDQIYDHELLHQGMIIDFVVQFQASERVKIKCAMDCQDTVPHLANARKAQMSKTEILRTCLLEIQQLYNPGLP